MVAMTGPDRATVASLSEERLIEALLGIAQEQDRVELARVRLTDRTVLLAICLDSPDAFEAADTALCLARRAVDAVPEMSRLRVDSFRLL
jgi:hypothetical protein